MLILRVLGLLLLVPTLASVVWEFVGWVQHGRWSIISAGELWFRLDSASLNLVQAVIQRYLLAELWDPVIQTVLTWPAWAVLGVPALALIVGAWPRRRGRFE
jgi:hypothetical protein